MKIMAPMPSMKVCPAYAGMKAYSPHRSPRRSRVPRVCGDERKMRSMRLGRSLSAPHYAGMKGQAINFIKRKMSVPRVMRGWKIVDHVALVPSRYAGMKGTFVRD